MLEVIGTGFGRTGTLSLKFALEELGFCPCYHMAETREHPDHDRRWLEVAKGQTDQWRRILQDYRATVDWPSAFVWREMIAAHPDAKVIHSLRPAAEWYASAEATIFRRMLDFREMLETGEAETLTAERRAHMEMIDAIVVEGSFGGDLGKEHAIATYEAHTEAVLAEVPPNRMLIYQPGDGWEPLCSFLDVLVPDTPYPQVNSTKDFNARFPPQG
ncbi:sulfotransferase family protein [Methyloligella solikamskensis]|uniref:Sulfotransferase family protein n=1 Tax=Methyloligella solikamskensis TaxID=1177756 RepID=A0ABW3J8G8_9HYPH